MTKPNMLKLAAWKSRKNPEYREALQQLLKDARTEYRQRRLLEACGINTISPIEQRWAKMIPGRRVWGLLNIVLLMGYGITPEDYDDHALATKLFEHMVVEHDDVDGFMAAMERMRVIRHRIYA